MKPERSRRGIVSETLIPSFSHWKRVLKARRKAGEGIITSTFERSLL
jgi:hypothetical protein